MEEYRDAIRAVIHRIAIVDDHPAVRDGLAMRINIESDLTVCWEASDGPDALHQFEVECPDLAVIDVSLKTGDGIELVKRLKASHPGARILVCSMYRDSLYAERALRAGAMGYINKENSTSKIVEAIRTVLADQVYLSPEMNARILKSRVMRQGDENLDPVHRLSDRELETFTLIGNGLRTQEIAQRMYLSPKTVETYRSRIKEKMGFSEINQLTRCAVQWVLENG